MEIHPRRRGVGLGLVAAVGLGFALACGSAEPSDSDTGVGCDGLCVGELQVVAPGGADTFTMTIYGEQFSTLNLSCPDGPPPVGGPGDLEVSCLDDGVLLTLTGLAFPETMTIAIDGGAETDYTPPWEEQSVCSSTCSSGVIEL